MITVKIVGHEEAINRLRSIHPTLQERLREEMKRQCSKLRAKVSGEKLSGQVLRNRTGMLRRSISYRVTSTETSVTGIVGTNKEYAAVHEYGFDGMVDVRSHMREIKQAFGKSLKGGPKAINVRSYSRHMKMPERSFLRSALREMDAEIREGIINAARDVMGKGDGFTFR